MDSQRTANRPSHSTLDRNLVPSHKTLTAERVKSEQICNWLQSTLSQPRVKVNHLVKKSKRLNLQLSSRIRFSRFCFLSTQGDQNFRITQTFTEQYLMSVNCGRSHRKLTCRIIKVTMIRLLLTLIEGLKSQFSTSRKRESEIARGFQLHNDKKSTTKIKMRLCRRFSVPTKAIQSIETQQILAQKVILSRQFTK